MPDKSVTSSTRLNHNAGLRELTARRKSNAGLTFPPSAADYECAGCITFHYLQFGHAIGIPFTTTNTSSTDVQGVSLYTTCSLYVNWVSRSQPPTPAVWTLRGFNLNFFGISTGIKQRMIDIGKKITFYFLQNV
jgi:hypothetical protein